MLQQEMLTEIKNMLIECGYSILIVEREAFDIIAKRDSRILLIKVLSNVDSYSEEQARDMKILASVLNATPLIISRKGRNFMVERGVVYERYDIPVVSPLTFRMVLEGDEIYVHSKKGKRVVSINGRRMRELRLQRNLSMEDLAKELNLTKKTIHLMEKEERASKEIIDKVETYFQERISVPINLFNWRVTSSKAPISQKLNSMGASKNFMIIKGFRCYFVKRSPADMVSVPRRKLSFKLRKRDKRTVVAAKLCVNRMDRNAIARFKRFADFCSIHKFVLTSEKQQKHVEGIAVLRFEDLNEIDKPEELIKLIKEKEEDR